MVHMVVAKQVLMHCTSQLQAHSEWQVEAQIQAILHTLTAARDCFPRYCSTSTASPAIMSTVSRVSPAVQMYDKTGRQYSQAEHTYATMPRQCRSPHTFRQSYQAVHSSGQQHV
jgi:hypothetical protein